jgi:hypothetical protein
MTAGDPKPQLNLRLRPDQDAVLRAAAFVNDKSTAEIARELIEDAIKRYAESPAIQQAMKARAEHRAEAEGKLTRIPDAHASGQ